MFALDHHPVTIQHLNVRSESHGDDECTAIDLKLSFDLPCEARDSCSPHLCESVYTKGDDGEPVLKHPQLAPLRMKGDYKPVALHLHASDLLSDDIKIEGTRIRRIVVAPRDGGTCMCSCQVQTHPDEDDAAKLLTLLKREVPATTEAKDTVDTD